jgi:hypothetical protein
MRLSIERRSARIWLTAPDGLATSLVMSDALGLADMVERMDAERALSDLRIQDVGVMRQRSGSCVTIHADDAASVCRISDFDVGTIGRMLRLAATTRVFAGSIGIMDEVPAAPNVSTVMRQPLDVDPVPLPTTTPAPRFTGGGTLSGFDLARRRRSKQQEPCQPHRSWNRSAPELPTFPWQPPQSIEIDVVDAMPAGMFAAMRALWHRFDEGAWIGIEWVRNYRGDEVWRTTRRDRPVTNREEISLETMSEMEAHGMVDDGGSGLRLPSQIAYDLWRATKLAGGMDYRDERMSSPVEVPVGFSAPGIEAVGDLGTCIVSFDGGRVTVHPYAIDDGTVGRRLASDLAAFGIHDSRTAEFATRIGDWLYPERHAYYGETLHNRLGRGPGRLTPTHADMGPLGWDAHFLALTALPQWRDRALGRYRAARTAPAIPVAMPAVDAPDGWKEDPLLRDGAEKRYRQILGRRRPKETT